MMCLVHSAGMPILIHSYKIFKLKLKGIFIKPPAQTSAVETQHQHSDVPASRNYQEESTQAQARQHETKRRTIVYSRNPHRIFNPQQEYNGFKRKNHQPWCTVDKQVETTGDSAHEVLEGQVRAVPRYRLSTQKSNRINNC